MAQESKLKMVNDNENPRVNHSEHGEGAATKPEDIRKHISEITQVKGPNHHSKFVALDGQRHHPDEPPITQQRNYPPPRNIRNIGLFMEESQNEGPSKRIDASEEVLDENAIRAGVRSVNGGSKWSDRSLRERWTKQEYDRAELPIGMEEEQKKKTNEPKSRQDIWARNVGMRSLAQQKKENKVENPASRGETSKPTAVNINQDTENVGANDNRFPFVEDPNDPDFASRQFRGVDNKDDFIVEHVGKVFKVTPRQYLLENITDDDFAFSRRNK